MDITNPYTIRYRSANFVHCAKRYTRVNLLEPPSEMIDISSPHKQHAPSWSPSRKGLFFTRSVSYDTRHIIRTIIVQFANHRIPVIGSTSAELQLCWKSFILRSTCAGVMAEFYFWEIFGPKLMRNSRLGQTISSARFMESMNKRTRWSLLLLGGAAARSNNHYWFDWERIPIVTGRVKSDSNERAKRWQCKCVAVTVQIVIKQSRW